MILLLRTKNWTIAALALCVFACQNNQAPNEAEAIMQTDRGGDFRGVHIGDAREEVLKMENAETVYNMPDELIYRAYPNGIDSTWYEITYNFNVQGLYDISLDVFPKTQSETKDLKVNFMNYYKQRYGECNQLNGYCTWRAMTVNGHIVSITLTDSLQFDQKPCLRVNFNESSQ
jgi:hypothetical protein